MSLSSLPYNQPTRSPTVTQHAQRSSESHNICENLVESIIAGKKKKEWNQEKAMLEKQSDVLQAQLREGEDWKGKDQQLTEILEGMATTARNSF